MFVVTSPVDQATLDVEGNYDRVLLILPCHFLFLLFRDVTVVRSIGMGLALVTVDLVATVRESGIVFNLTVEATMDIPAGFPFVVDLASKGLELTVTGLAFNLWSFHFVGWKYVATEAGFWTLLWISVVK